jgi:hypothetical protein
MLGNFLLARACFMISLSLSRLGVDSGQFMRAPFRIQELNPFQEWHLHGSSDSFDDAKSMAEEICQQIRVSVRILNQADEVVASFEPKN